MNLIMLGGAFLGALVLGVNGEVAVKAVPLKATSAPVQPAAVATAEQPEQPGFMTRNINVDPNTGETTEISVIGFVD